MLSKRLFDFSFAFLALVFLLPVMLVMALMAAMDTRSNGFFLQKRIGQYGRPFIILKLRTMHSQTQRISAFGRFLRRTKIDELPQLLHVLVGQMSVVGPRPDVPGYYDALKGEDRKVLDLKPGLTSKAGLKYYNEDFLLSQQEDPLWYNDTVLFPDKVRLNLDYYHHRTFVGDLRIIWKTLQRAL